MGRFWRKITKIGAKITTDMRWYHDKRVNEGVLRHPTDSEAWKFFDQIDELFTLDPHTVRVGLATDNFNPFGNMSILYNT